MIGVTDGACREEQRSKVRMNSRISFVPRYILSYFQRFAFAKSVIRIDLKPRNPHRLRSYTLVPHACCVSIISIAIPAPRYGRSVGF